MIRIVTPEFIADGLCAQVDPERVQVAEFVVPGEPVSKARARFTGYGSKARAYTPANVVAAERAIAAAYSREHGLHDDPEMAFGVEVEFLHETGQRRDIDNMLKAVFDALNGVAWPDDVQVTSVTASKRRVPKGEAETRVTIYSLGRINKPRGRCEHCGTEFSMYASTSARRFCTRECGYEWRRARRSRMCEQCGDLYDHSAPNGPQRFCSTACSRAATHVDVTCAACGTAFSKPRSLVRSGNAYCSESCKATYWRERSKSVPKGTCQDCGGGTSKAHYKRCRDCAFAAGGRWADRDEATCPTCHQFVADGAGCPNHPKEAS